MVRISSTSLLTLGVPAAVFFVLTANPARLYAEAGLPPPLCTAEEVTACSGLSNGATCAYDGGSGTCQSELCQADAGNISALRCRPVVVPACASGLQIADCVGKTVGESCGSSGGGGHCGTLQCPTADGGTEPTLACLYTGAEIDTEAGPPKEAGPGNDGSTGQDSGGSDAGTNGKNDASPTPYGDDTVDDSSCSCTVVGGGASGLASFAALGLALAAIARRRRR